jgi:uncharacterized protein YggE
MAKLSRAKPLALKNEATEGRLFRRAQQMKSDRKISTMFILAGFFMMQNVSAQTRDQIKAGNGTQPRTIFVNGTGQVSAQPDHAIIRLGVETDGASAAQALSQNSEKMQVLLHTFKKAGVAAADIQTDAIRLQPRYEQIEREQPRPPRVVGYSAVNVVEIRTRNLDKLGELLDATVKAGGNVIEGVRFAVSDPSNAIAKAREEAMQNARQKAQQLATLAKAQLGEVLTINESNRQWPLAQESMMMQRADVPVEPGSQSLRVEVQVTWLLQ